MRAGFIFASAQHGDVRCGALETSGEGPGKDKRDVSLRYRSACASHHGVGARDGVRRRCFHSGSRQRLCCRGMESEWRESSAVDAVQRHNGHGNDRLQWIRGRRHRPARNNARRANGGARRRFPCGGGNDLEQHGNAHRLSDCRIPRPRAQLRHPPFGHWRGSKSG